MCVQDDKKALEDNFFLYQNLNSGFKQGKHIMYKDNTVSDI